MMRSIQPSGPSPGRPIAGRAERTAPGLKQRTIGLPGASETGRREIGPTVGSPLFPGFDYSQWGDRA
jgi:hypothetical protein